MTNNEAGSPLYTDDGPIDVMEMKLTLEYRARIAELEATHAADMKRMEYLEILNAKVRDERWDFGLKNKELEAARAADAQTIAQLRAQVKQHDSDWLAMLRVVADVSPDNENEWAQADDAALLEEFDPWQALRELKAQVAAQREWEDAQYNDIINIDNNNQIRVVINHDNPDGKVHLHIRKRKDGEWRHVGITTLAQGWRIQQRRTQPGGEGDNE